MSELGVPNDPGEKEQRVICEEKTEIHAHSLSNALDQSKRERRCCTCTERHEESIGDFDHRHKKNHIIKWRRGENADDRTSSDGDGHRSKGRGDSVRNVIQLL